MSIEKLKTVYSTGAFVNNVKTFFKKINEIIDALNTLIAGGNSGSSYTVYTGLISQSGTDAPTIVISENTLGVTVSFSRANTGIYVATFSSDPTLDATKIILVGNARGAGFFSFSRILTSAITFRSYDFMGNQADDILSNHFFEIRVYS